MAIKLKCPLGHCWYAKFGDEAVYIDKPISFGTLTMHKRFHSMPCELEIHHRRVFATSAYLELRAKC